MPEFTYKCYNNEIVSKIEWKRALLSSRLFFHFHYDTLKFSNFTTLTHLNKKWYDSSLIQAQSHLKSQKHHVKVDSGGILTHKKPQNKNQKNYKSSIIGILQGGETDSN